MTISFYDKLTCAWNNNSSLVCVGLDSDPLKLPQHLAGEKQRIFKFNRAIIDATADLVCAYKPNIAFYSGTSAEEELILTIGYLKDTYPNIPIILDSKRGDIGNTAELYAQESYEKYGADAVTVSPYMGSDSLEPFLKYTDRGVIVLCRTSNPGAKDLQDLLVGDTPLYLRVAELAATQWNTNNNIGLVVGATVPDELSRIRAAVGDNIPFLVPGIGAQGGDLSRVVRSGINSLGTGLIINSSRGIIFASSGKDFAEAARKETTRLRAEIVEAKESQTKDTDIGLLRGVSR
jgi:orotidine-5'-phosphate decarboxylase